MPHNLLGIVAIAVPFWIVRYKAGLETRQRILDATRELLGETGLDATTVSAICEKAAIGAGSFYNLFETKEQAILTVARDAINAVDPDPAGGGDASDLVEAYVRFVEDQPQLARVYVVIAVGGGLTDPQIRGRILRHHQERVARFTEAVRRSDAQISSEDCVVAAEALLAALNGYAFHAMLDQEFDFGGHARRLLRARITS